MDNADFMKAFQDSFDRGDYLRELERQIDKYIRWLKTKIKDINEFLASADSSSIHLCKSLLSSLQCEVREHKSNVEGILKRGYRFIESSPDTFLYVDLTSLEYQWQLFRQKYQALKQHILTKQKSSSRDSVGLCYVQSLNKNEQTQPLYQKIPSATEKKVAVRVSSERSLLAEKGRTHVTKLSIPYRVFIKSKSQQRRSVLSDHTGSESSGSTVSLSSDIGSSVTSPQSLRCLREKLLAKLASRLSSPSSSPRSDQSGTHKPFAAESESESKNLLHVPSQATSEANLHQSRHAAVDEKSESEDVSYNEFHNLIRLKSAFPVSVSGLNTMEEMDFNESTSSLFDRSLESPRLSGSVSPRGSGSTSPEPRLLLGPRASPTKMEDSPIQTKRRCMNGDISSRPQRLKLENPGRQIFDESFDSNVSSPTDSPSTLRTSADIKVKYKKDELWAAIQSDYQYLMDEEIIDACKSTESDLSWDDDDLSINTKVSFTEFMQQYKELTDWLNQIQLVTQRQSCSRSEKYLNQTYHEEMLQSSPRRKLFNHYAKQLMRRYPNMKEEITVRLQHLNNLWAAIERSISPAQGYQDEETMLKDLEEDLSGLRRWLHEVEGQLLPLCLRATWTSEELENKLKEHQVLQRDIESRSKIVSAVLKLCERLQHDKQACSSESEREGLQLVAINLERRWHAIWLQSLEWQCRLEEAISKKIGLKESRPGDSEWTDFGYTGRVSRRAVHYSDDLLHDIGDHDKSDLTDTCDETECDAGLDSDSQSNPDIIPFPEYEYEKITIDSDTQTEDYEGKTSFKFGSASREKYAASVSIKEIDSSDQNIQPDGTARRRSTITHSTIELSTDKGRPACEKEPSFRTSEKVVMRTSSSIMGSAGQKRGSRFHRSFAHDVGYSSESHSNEDPDLSASPLSEKDQSDSNSDIIKTERDPVLSSVDYHDNRHPEQKLTTSVVHVAKETQETVVLREKHVTDNISVTDGSIISKVSPGSGQQTTWQHSVTSAYNKSSIISDLEKTTELQGELSSGTELEVSRKQFKYKQIISSPNQKFYTMTTVETDSESVERQQQAHLYHSDVSFSQNVDRQNVTDLSIDTDSSFLNFSESRNTVTLVNNNNDNSKTDIGTDLDLRFSELDSSQNDRTAKGDANTFHDQNGVVNGEWDEIVSTSLPASNTVDSCSNCRQLADENRTVHPGQQNGDSFPIGEVVSPPIASESVRRLIRHAELMVMDEDLLRLQNAKWYQHRRGSKSKQVKSASQQRMMDSLTSTDGSLPTEEDVRASSCDASGEYTSGSESDAEYSTASSDEGGAGDSMILSSQASSPTRNSADIITSTPNADVIASTPKASSEPPHLPSSVSNEVKLRPKRIAKRRGDRPWSVTELYELHNRLDLTPFSISESAINRKSSSLQNLRHTTSQLSSLAIGRIDTPMRNSRHGIRKLKRSASECEQVQSSESSPSLLHLSPKSTPQRRYSAQEHRTESNTSSTDHKTISCGEQSVSSYHSDRSAARRLNMNDTARELNRDANESEYDLQEKMPSLGHQPEFLGHLESEDTDGVMNSTLESFSEQAWDNYLHSPYPSMSDDVPEEKLDDTNLNWDTPGLEFEDDFQISQQVSLSVRKSSEKTGRRSPEKCRPRDRRTSSTKSTPHRYHDDASLEDSDSDIEDLHHVITESRDSYSAVESALKKHHKDQMETGIDLDYSEYAELLATCETNIRCLQVVSDTLDSKDGILTGMDEELQEVEDIIQQWEELLELAIERHGQSRELSVIYKDMMTIKSTVQDVTEQLEVTFTDVKDLEDSIKSIQDCKLSVHSAMDQLSLVKRAVTEFSDAHATVDMSKSYAFCTNLQEQVNTTDERCSSRVSELQVLLLSWYEFGETRKELTYLLNQEKRQLQCVDMMQGVMDFTYQDTRDTVNDLKAMQTDLDDYENKLETLQRLCKDLQAVCDEHTGSEMQDSVDVVKHELTTIKAKCKEVKDKLESKMRNQQVVETSVPVLNAEGVLATESLDEVDGADQISVRAAVLSLLHPRWLTSPRRQMFLRILKVALPVQLLVLLLLGAVYLLEPGCCDHMNGFGDFGFSWSPQLRYVNGPPPT